MAGNAVWHTLPVMPSAPLVPISGPGEEHRRFPRYNIALDVLFGPIQGQATRPDDAQLIRTVTVNVSLGGACVYSNVRFPIGTQLICRMLPGRQAPPVEAVGVVAWFHGSSQDGRGYKLGIEFTSVPPETRKALQALFDNPPTTQTGRSKRVLLVDDDQELSLALKVRFELSGFDVLVAGDGVEAMQQTREQHPHVIIMDLMLPRLGGYDVCRLLKFDQKLRHIPIILFSARSRREDIETGYAVGADAYFTKPCDGQGLIEKVEEMLRGHAP